MTEQERREFDYRAGYTAGYSDAKNGEEFRDEHSALLHLDPVKAVDTVAAIGESRRETHRRATPGDTTHDG